MFQLIGQGHAENAFTLSTNVAVLIGRGDSCGVQLKDPSASRVHCRVIAHDGRVKLYDAGSRWGTFVNGQRVTECDLQPGDRIKVGETTLQLTIVFDAYDVTLARRSALVRPLGITVRLDQSPMVSSVSDQERLIDAE